MNRYSWKLVGDRAQDLFGFGCIFILQLFLVLPMIIESDRIWYFKAFAIMTLPIPLLLVYLEIRKGLHGLIAPFKGDEGEKRIQSIVQAHTGYKTIRDVQLPNVYGNIDLIAVGNKGVFAIEVKNVGASWKNYLDDYARQAEQSARAINALIASNLNIPVWVHAAVVFCDSKWRWEKRIRQAHILNEREVSKWIMDNKNVLSSKQIQDIVQLISTQSSV